MKVAVVIFPGSNCDADAVHVTHNILGVATERVWHQAVRLPLETTLVVLPGGFSYGDALRSGALARFSPIMKAVQSHAEAGGLVLGICNGFQVLVEAGLLPGAMLQNTSRKFVCRMIELEVGTNDSPFTQGYRSGERIRMPVAHHEGRYFLSDGGLKRLEDEHRVAFRYREGMNPNGSLGGIAGILGARRNVLGLMPHPERACEDVLGSSDGRRVFEAALGALKGGVP